MSAAADAAGVGRRTAYDHRQRDEDFAREWDDILEEAIEEMEAEAYRRAVEGVEKPVFQGGVQVGTVREYSDALIMFLLRARKPRAYVERHQLQHRVAPQEPSGWDLARLSDEQLDALEKLSEVARPGAEESARG